MSFKSIFFADWVLSHPRNFNFIQLSLTKINFILLSRNCVGKRDLYIKSIPPILIPQKVFFTIDSRDFYTTFSSL